MCTHSGGNYMWLGDGAEVDACVQGRTGAALTGIPCGEHKKAGTSGMLCEIPRSACPSDLVTAVVYR